jgi:regulator of replication initiation timing
MNNLQMKVEEMLEDLREENKRLARLVTELMMKNQQLRAKLDEQLSASQPLIPAQRIP